MENYQLLIVRFTLPATGFVPWHKLKKTMPAEEAAEWEQMAAEDGEDPSAWRLRREPVPLTSVLRVDVGGPGRWSRIKATPKYCHEISNDPPTMSFEIDGFHYYSSMTGTGYGYYVPDRDELAEMWEDPSEDFA